jgi:hypothetical protein
VLPPNQGQALPRPGNSIAPVRSCRGVLPTWSFFKVAARVSISERVRMSNPSSPRDLRGSGRTRKEMLGNSTLRMQQPTKRR